MLPDREIASLCWEFSRQGSWWPWVSQVRQQYTSGHPTLLWEGLCPCGHSDAGMDGLPTKSRITAPGQSAKKRLIPCRQQMRQAASHPSGPLYRSPFCGGSTEPRSLPFAFVLVSCGCRDKASQTKRLQAAEMDSHSLEAKIKVEEAPGVCSRMTLAQDRITLIAASGVTWLSSLHFVCPLCVLACGHRSPRSEVTPLSVPSQLVTSALTLFPSKVTFCDVGGSDLTLSFEVTVQPVA